eukprot:9278439-Alexandrium_andersonii.AAC.1
MLPLQIFIAELRFADGTDRHIEAQHAKLNKRIRNVPNFAGHFVSHAVRWQELWDLVQPDPSAL